MYAVVYNTSLTDLELPWIHAPVVTNSVGFCYYCRVGYVDYYVASLRAALSLAPRLSVRPPRASDFIEAANTTETLI